MWSGENSQEYLINEAYSVLFWQRGIWSLLPIEMQGKFCSVGYDIVTCRLSTEILLGNRGSQGPGPGDGDVLLPQPSPEVRGSLRHQAGHGESPGQKASHILAAVHSPKQTVHRTTGLWLLVQLSPIRKPCRTHRQEVLGEHGSDKILLLLTQLSPWRKRDSGTGLLSKQRSDLSAVQPCHCSLGVPLLSVPQFPSSQECNLPLPQLAFTYSSQTCFSWNIIIQKIT